MALKFSVTVAPQPLVKKSNFQLFDSDRTLHGREDLVSLHLEFDMVLYRTRPELLTRTPKLKR